ncbi:hypothetical protein GPECTOR_3g199 [Gonium pectorale]|uniref:ARID domain-containing protein n=1 Tax=Gonium pectorale TaxID=33097 RepID=A0A150GZJ3_GONPE|nr:hypothetical protein GPECTOR_3g199 [Gonium pectorale]|eukprot:KXZ55038.1 hypothetical protein GPECTOR_3g199 [Gonium pectorale]
MEAGTVNQQLASDHPPNRLHCQHRHYRPSCTYTPFSCQSIRVVDASGQPGKSLGEWLAGTAGSAGESSRQAFAWLTPDYRAPQWTDDGGDGAAGGQPAQGQLREQLEAGVLDFLSGACDAPPLGPGRPAPNAEYGCVAVGSHTFDLRRMYAAVRELGGYSAAQAIPDSWERLADSLGLDGTARNVAHACRTTYEHFLLRVERLEAAREVAGLPPPEPRGVAHSSSPTASGLSQPQPGAGGPSARTTVAAAGGQQRQRQPPDDVKLELVGWGHEAGPATSQRGQVSRQQSGPRDPRDAVVVTVGGGAGGGFGAAGLGGRGGAAVPQALDREGLISLAVGSGSGPSIRLPVGRTLAPDGGGGGGLSAMAFAAAAGQDSGSWASRSSRIRAGLEQLHGGAGGIGGGGGGGRGLGLQALAAELLRAEAEAPPAGPSALAALTELLAAGGGGGGRPGGLPMGLVRTSSGNIRIGHVAGSNTHGGSGSLPGGAGGGGGGGFKRGPPDGAPGDYGAGPGKRSAM